MQTMPPALRAAAARSMTTGRGALGRRTLLRAAGLGAVAAAGLTGCGIPAAGRTGDTAASTDHSAQEKVVDFSNWDEYIDVTDDGKHRPTLEEFTRRTGIKVAYTEDINDNVEFFGKIKPQLAAGQDTGRDLMVLTDWLAGRMIRLGWVQELDPAHLPHAYANLEQRFRSPQWDPGRAYSYPWTGIPTCIAYNKKVTKGRAVTSISQLLDDPALKGKAAMLSEMRDTVGMTLLDMGKRPETVDDDSYDAALARIQGAVDRGQIRKFTGGEYTDGLSKGDIAACVAWAGDLVQLRLDDPDIAYAFPEAGHMISTDNLLVPDKARHKTNAEKLIDYYYQPPVAAKLAAYITYVSPVRGVREELAKIDPSLADNPLIIPDAAMDATSHEFRSLSDEEDARYEEKFSKLIGA
ncbi:spermidine/putrescine ABC transporter substrate-binding protein [Actinacidiphila sp. DG2A-62]|jgi:spermidine/putrescine transport system substrate-binding protein|uniref:polyamine ABC transporter substrate-binding protein n=1 Tax=Actinacidiphila sp. DG2A-62 TaxID=3108821 RepID=UPI002DB6696C|nr:spermidine/putrescine ABC transporter substrate-binding protein [Actinacidiphila sp. DG2A-62]MEC3997482.1 spermidine/putrescine ABC transporter substrate-binding protein [Actinacidiphila sp. DG2A-62]